MSLVAAFGILNFELGISLDIEIWKLGFQTLDSQTQLKAMRNEG